MPSISGGGLIAAMLAAEGVEVVFGIIDGTYFGLYAAFEEHGIRRVGPRHESSAARGSHAPNGRSTASSVIHVDVDPVAHMWAPSLKHFKDMHQEPRG